MPPTTDILKKIHISIGIGIGKSKTVWWCGEMKKKRDILANNGMLCAMSCKIEKCRTRHFTVRLRAPVVSHSLAIAPPSPPISISFPINVNYVIFLHKRLKQTTNDERMPFTSRKMVRKNRWNSLVLLSTLVDILCWMSFKVFNVDVPPLFWYSYQMEQCRQSYMIFRISKHLPLN